MKKNQKFYRRGRKEVAQGGTDKGRKPENHLRWNGRRAPWEPKWEITENDIKSATEQFTHCLTEKLLTYAIGRELGISARPEVDSIVQALHQDDKGLGDLITLVVLSDTFRSN